MNASVCLLAVGADGQERGREGEEEAGRATRRSEKMKRLRDKSSVPEALWMAPGMHDTYGKVWVIGCACSEEWARWGGLGCGGGREGGGGEEVNTGAG